MFALQNQREALMPVLRHSIIFFDSHRHFVIEDLYSDMYSSFKSFDAHIGLDGFSTVFTHLLAKGFASRPIPPLQGRGQFIRERGF